MTRRNNCLVWFGSVFFVPTWPSTATLAFAASVGFAASAASSFNFDFLGRLSCRYGRFDKRFRFDYFHQFWYGRAFYLDIYDFLEGDLISGENFVYLFRILFVRFALVSFRRNSDPNVTFSYIFICATDKNNN